LKRRLEYKGWNATHDRRLKRGIKMRVKYDKVTDTLSINFVNRKVKESEYLENQGTILDYDKNNNLIGIEILSVSKKWSLKELSKLYYEPMGV